MFPAQFFTNPEHLIGCDLEGRIYTDTRGRRVRFYLDFEAHLDEDNREAAQSVV